MYIYIIIFSFLASFSAYNVSFGLGADDSNLHHLEASRGTYALHKENISHKSNFDEYIDNNKIIAGLLPLQSKDIQDITEADGSYVGKLNKRRDAIAVKAATKAKAKSSSFKITLPFIGYVKKTGINNVLFSKKNAYTKKKSTITQSVDQPPDHPFIQQAISSVIPPTKKINKTQKIKKDADVEENSTVSNDTLLHADAFYVEQIGDVIVSNDKAENKNSIVKNQPRATKNVVLPHDKAFVMQLNNSPFVRKKSYMTQETGTIEFVQNELSIVDSKNQPNSQQLVQKVIAEQLVEPADVSVASIGINNVKTINLEFEKSENRIAAFKKSGWVWLIFEGKTKTDLAKVLQEKFANAFKIIPSEQYTILKIKAENVPKITPNLNFYLLDFNDKNNIIQNREIIATTESDAKFPIPFDEPMIILNIEDPDSSEKMKVIPVKKEANSVRLRYNYPHFKIIAAEFGIVFMNVADSVNISNEGNFVNVNFPKFVQVKHDDIKPLSTPIFQFCKWYFDDPNDFYNANLRLGFEIANASSSELLEKQLNLVKFYLAHQMSREALGHLKYIKSHHFDAASNNAFILLYGAALYLSNLSAEADQAFATLDVALLNNDQLAELNFWRSLAKIEAGKESASLDVYYKTTACTHAYYNDIAITLLHNEVNLGINTKKIDELYDFIRALKLSPNKINEVLVIFARFMLNSGNDAKGIEILSKVAENLEDPKVRAEAVFEKTKHLVRNYSISVKEAIDILNSLKIVWHGKDKLEGNIIRTLAQNYLVDHQYYQSLKALDEINVDSDVSHSLFLDVGKKMKDIFSDIFYNSRVSQTIDSFEKIKIFLAFDNLVPIGLKGIDLSFKFVANLLDLNLVSPAIAILEHLISFRLEGEAKNKAILMVADLYLNSKEYEKIIVNSQNWNFASEELVYIKSKAYLGVKDYVNAEQIIENHTSQRAYYIKAYIYWNSSNAVKMKKLLEPQLKIRDNPSNPLSELEKLSVLYLANSYALLNEKENFLSLYSAFAEMLKDDPKYYESIAMLHTVLILDKVEQLGSVQKSLNDLINSKINLASI